MVNNDLSIKSYTDLHELNKLKQAGRDDDPRALQAVAEQFESLFLNMLLKNMRQANEAISKDGLFDSSEGKFYQEMMDQQLAMSMSAGKGIGLSEVLVRQLSPAGEAPQVDVEKTSQLNQPTRHADGVMNQMMDRTVELAMQASIKRAAVAVEKSAVSHSEKVDQIDRFDSPEQFVDAMMPVAANVAAESGIPAAALVAQAALETGWGKHLPRHSDGSNSHNLFGIKADQRWDGERLTSTTLEFRDGVARQEKASFRGYSSYEHSMRDYVAFVSQSPRYQAALEQADNAKGYIEQLQLAGYATDPAYSQKISGILDSDVLQRVLNPHKGG
ncbi:MAG: flagellar assembly peptidoglycan hydrolase FlgJ [Motiliproteus sp.]